MTKHKVNCVVDFLHVILNGSLITVVTLPEFMLVILAAGFQESYGKAFVNVMLVRVAAEVERIIVALVLNLSYWAGSQPSWCHLCVDMRQANVL